MFEKNLSFLPLFDTYGKLLTDTQQKMFELYYGDDLSLSEIADEMKITRQGVRDSIKRCEEALVEFEEKLGFLKKINELSAAAHTLADSANDKNKVSEIAERLLALCE